MGATVSIDPVALDLVAFEERARQLGALLEGGDVLLLEGPMGAGKTTFTRALAEGLGLERPDRVCSPTYTVCMVHPGRLELVHVDFFRLGETSPGGVTSPAFDALGLAHDELPGPQQVLVVEWADLWVDPPNDLLRVRLALGPDGDASRRTLIAEAVGDRSTRLLRDWLG